MGRGKSDLRLLRSRNLNNGFDELTGPAIELLLPELLSEPDWFRPALSRIGLICGERVWAGVFVDATERRFSPSRLVSCDRRQGRKPCSC